MRQVFADTETTGLDASNGHRIVELALIEVIDRVPTGKVLHTYVNPERSIDAEAGDVHGITREMLADKPKFREVVSSVVEFLRGADEFVAHNAPFDVSFFDEEFSRMRQPSVKELVGSVRDSLKLAKELYPGKKNSLDALCERLSVDTSHREKHGALLDTELLVEAYLKMTEGVDLSYNPDEERVLTISRLPADRGSVPVRHATDAELAAHSAYLADMEKETKKSPVFSTFSQKDAAVAPPVQDASQQKFRF